MALFKCIKTHTHASTVERRQIKGPNDTVRVVEIDREIVITPGAYGHENIKVDEVYEINGRLAEKARRNTEYFTEVKEAKVQPIAKAKKKPRGRPKVTKEADDVSDSGGDTQQSA